MIERLTAWECKGCGRVDAPGSCIGVCEDRRTEFVRAADYDAALTEAGRLRDRVERLAAVLRQLAGTIPRNGGWEGSYRALQRRALAALKGEE